MRNPKRKLTLHEKRQVATGGLVLISLLILFRLLPL